MFSEDSNLVLFFEELTKVNNFLRLSHLKFKSWTGSTQGGQLHSGDSIDQVLSHEVKELGTHILVCEVSYSAPGKSKMNFRKFFKFNVMKPLDVKTKFYNAEVSIKDILISKSVASIYPVYLQGVSHWNVSFELTLTDRNMQVRFWLPCSLVNFPFS